MTLMPNEPKPTSGERARLSAAHFENYQEYNKVLRTWFVTFGIGAPAAFLINDKLADKLHGYGHHVRIITYFLIGCGLQVFIALINKFTAWHNYDDCQRAVDRDTYFHNACRWLGNQFWIDMIFDVGTALAFLYAVVGIVKIFA